MAESYDEGQVVRVVTDIRLPDGVELTERELAMLSKDVSDYTHLAASKHRPDPEEDRHSAHVHTSTEEHRCRPCHHLALDLVQ